MYKNSRKKAVLLPIKSLSDDDPGFRHGFGAEALLPLTQGAPAVSHNTKKVGQCSRGQPEGSLFIATTPRCREGATHFTLDTYLILLSVKQGGIKYHF